MNIEQTVEITGDSSHMKENRKLVIRRTGMRKLVFRVDMANTEGHIAHISVEELMNALRELGIIKSTPKPSFYVNEEFPAD
ncbi:hypothetical protein OAX78_00115 [Planctomycetota bacterium]|nr:hypothetical protein [Planctomycetota bacterium]